MKRCNVNFAGRLGRISATALIAAAAAAIAVGCTSVQPPLIRFTGTPAASPSFDQAQAGVYRGVIAADRASGTFEIRMRPQPPSTAAAPAAAPLFAFSLSRTGPGGAAGEAPALLGGGPGSASKSTSNTVVYYSGTIGEAPDQFKVRLNITLGPAGTVQKTECMVDGAPAVAVTVKELSTRQVVTFEGSYTGTNSGTWNMIIAGQAAFAVYASYDGADQGMVRGSRNANSLELTGPRGLVQAAGDITSATTIRGSWSEQLGEPGKGTFFGNRSQVSSQ